MSIKISELTSGTTLDGTEVLPIVQDGATVKITTQDVADLASSSGAVWGGITGDITDQTDLVTALNLKVDAVPGKGLSANDFTNTLKTKLDGIEDGAQVNVNADVDVQVRAAIDVDVDVEVEVNVDVYVKQKSIRKTNVYVKPLTKSKGGFAELFI